MNKIHFTFERLPIMGVNIVHASTHDGFEGIGRGKGEALQDLGRQKRLMEKFQRKQGGFPIAIQIPPSVGQKMVNQVRSA